tara:strand:- start:1254 stop:1565 length:312 start_codon:yes stop_codon:yes gene_type:complete
MASKSKIKGNAYERELVIFFEQRGFIAERARGSDGRSLGMDEDVDGYFKISRTGAKIKFQAKRRKVIPKWLQLGNSDIVCVREDRGNTKVIIDLNFFLELIGK